MDYDPIKEYLGKIFNRHSLLRRLFYRMLDILLLRSWHVRRALKSIGSELPHDAAVLDAGMGFGQYTWWMASRFPAWQITAVDLKSEQVADCNSFFAKTGIAGSTRAHTADLVTWRGNSEYDLILCVDVMEHILEDQTVFENFRDMSAAGAYLVISTPSDLGGSDVHTGEDASFIGEHVRNGYGREEITGKLQSAGYGEVKAAYTYGTPGSIAWRLTMKYPVMMLSASKLFFILLPLWYLIVMPFALILNYADLIISHRKGTGLLVIARTT